MIMMFIVLEWPNFYSVALLTFINQLLWCVPNQNVYYGLRRVTVYYYVFPCCWFIGHCSLGRISVAGSRLDIGSMSTAMDIGLQPLTALLALGILIHIGSHNATKVILWPIESRIST